MLDEPTIWETFDKKVSALVCVCGCIQNLFNISLYLQNVNTHTKVSSRTPDRKCIILSPYFPSFFKHRLWSPRQVKDESFQRTVCLFSVRRESARKKQRMFMCESSLPWSVTSSKPWFLPSHVTKQGHRDKQKPAPLRKLSLIKKVLCKSAQVRYIVSSSSYPFQGPVSCVVFQKIREVLLQIKVGPDNGRRHWDWNFF